MNILKTLILIPLGFTHSVWAAPNIIIAISDDQSWEHVGVYGADWIDTPNIDRLADEGIRFNHAYAQVPSCSTARATFLTGRQPWQLQEGSTLWSTVPGRYPSLMDVLKEAGYHTGYSRKGWGPGNNTLGGRSDNPAGKSYSNFLSFMSQRLNSQSFCYWFGSKDPHRSYDLGSGLASGKHQLSDVVVPEFLPDSTTVRSDLLDYGFEIERFDSEIGDIINHLNSIGELDNTIFIVTSDNGLPFPGAKANLYDHGTRVPLVIRYPEEISAGVVTDAFIGFADLMPTLLDAVDVQSPSSVTGLSYWDFIKSPETVEPLRDFISLYLTRHSHCRFDMLGYPMRGIRTHDYLYIRNFEPDREPAGDAPDYLDVDGSPSKTFLLDNADSFPELFQRSFGKRPEEELFAINDDPYSMNNLADDPDHLAVKAMLANQMESFFRENLDPLYLGFGRILEGNPYTRGSFNKNFGGTEVLRSYHPDRLAEFKAWLVSDDDGDAIYNLMELSLYGDPISAKNGYEFKFDSNNQATMGEVEGVWPWVISLETEASTGQSPIVENGVIVIPAPQSEGAAELFRITTEFELSVP